MNGETIFLALGELEEELIHEARQNAPRRSAFLRRLPLIAAAAVLLSLLFTALAYGIPELTRYKTALGDEITPNGRHTGLRSGGKTLCEVRNGRIILFPEGDAKDITDLCSETQYYAWETTYEDGVRLLVLAGGTPEAAGGLYVYFFPDGVKAFDLPNAYDYDSAEWFPRAVSDYGLEFLCPEPPDYGDLAVPTTKELLEHGYPVNALGETYGPMVRWMPEEPDLLLAAGKDGVVGYIRQTELNDPYGLGEVHTPEEATAWNKYTLEHGPTEIPLYREDGVTVIGSVPVGN